MSRTYSAVSSSIMTKITRDHDRKSTFPSSRGSSVLYRVHNPVKSLLRDRDAPSLCLVFLRKHTKFARAHDRVFGATLNLAAFSWMQFCAWENLLAVSEDLHVGGLGWSLKWLFPHEILKLLIWLKCQKNLYKIKLTVIIRMTITLILLRNSLSIFPHKTFPETANKLIHKKKPIREKSSCDSFHTHTQMRR